MAMDHFHEESVTKRNNIINKILYAMSWVVIVLGAIVAAWGINVLITTIFNGGFDVVTLILTLVSGGVAAYAFFFHDKLMTEYEYTFTNGTLDFAEVYNNKRRKDLGSLNVRTVDAFGKVSSGSFQRYLKTPNLKRMNWFVNRDAELYYFYFSKDNVKKMIIFEPSETLVNLILEYLPRGVYQNN